MLFISFAVSVSAHPGNTASDGMHYCWTNCSSWGEVYGQRHGHGGYTSSYSPPTYESNQISSNSDCPSYGFAYLGSCYQLPSNARKAVFTGFDCNYGYEKVGYSDLTAQCLPEIDNGYRIGSTIFCDYGYEKSGSRCYKKQNDYGSLYTPASFTGSVQSVDPYKGKEFKYYYWLNTEDNEIEKGRISSQCLEDGEDHAHKPYFKDGNYCSYCNPGYITDKDKESCHAMTDVCEAVYGEGSIPLSDGKCKCDTGYSMVKGQCKADKKVSTTESANASSSPADLQKQISDLLALIALLQSQSR